MSSTSTTPEMPVGFIARNLPFSLEVVIGIAVGCVAFVLIICVAVACCCCRREARRRRVSGSGVDNLKNKRLSQNNDYLNHKVASDIGTDGHVQRAKRKLQRGGKLSFKIKDILTNAMAKQVESYLVDEKRLSLGEVLGSGQFGIVYKASMTDKSLQNPKEVAVKTMQGEECTENEVQEFLDEVILMRGFHHSNVLSMIGMSIIDDKPYVVLPFMANGDLKTYIQDPERQFVIRDLLEMCSQVSAGMTYLAEQGFVHRDLAARNCMVSNDLDIKIADFGLSRDIYTDAYYRMESLNTPLPVRWMAVESLDSKIFTHKSDVWSFGIMMWEVMNRGRNPYPERDNHNVITYVKLGGRLSQPPHLNEDIYNIMKSCWEEDPSKRPHFSELSKSLNLMLEGTSKPNYMNVVETRNNTPKKKSK